MSLRIKIPASKPPPPDAGTDMEGSSVGRRKRKLPKRYQQDEDEDFLDAIEPASKQSKSNLSNKSKRIVSGFDSPSDAVEDAEFGEGTSVAEPTVDVEMDDDDFEESQQTVASSSSAGNVGKSRKDKERQSHGRKKAKVVISDSEDEDYGNASQDISMSGGGDDEDEGGYLSAEERESRPSKGKSKASSSTSKSSKRKTATSEAETLPDEEEKRSEVAPRKKFKGLGKSDDGMVDIVGEGSSTIEGPGSVAATSISPSTSKHESPAPVPPPKKKLPTIKKNRIPPGTNVGTSTPTGPKKAADLTGAGRPTHEDIRQTIINKTDIDLSDKSIYQSLFSKTVANDTSIRTGVNREERRRELNKMREEAKAKREQEAVHSFDLQAQYEKISRFEERLRSARSTAQYPNYLGAKWKDVFDREKIKPKEMPWEGSQDVNGKEEGELS